MCSLPDLVQLDSARQQYQLITCMHHPSTHRYLYRVIQVVNTYSFMIEQADF